MACLVGDHSISLAHRKPPIFIPAKPVPGAWTLDDFKTHMQTAVVLEFNTIPLYLFAMFAIKTDTPSGVTARQAIHDIVVQEMLHLGLSGNILRSVGGTPTLYDPKYLPKFPSLILYTKIEMNLRKPTRENIQTFVAIEAPDTSSSNLLEETQLLPDYRSIGDFYKAIEQNLDPSWIQAPSAPFQFSAGDNVFGSEIFPIVVVADAMRAMTTIVEQGEGTPGHPSGHFVQFEALRDSKEPWNYYPVVENPDTEMYQGRQFYMVSRTFDAVYCYLILMIQVLWTIQDGDPRRQPLCSGMFDAMFMLTDIANFLLGESYDATRVAAPCFSIFNFVPSPPFKQQVQETIASAIDQYSGDPTKKAALESIQASINGLPPLLS